MSEKPEAPLDKPSSDGQLLAIVNWCADHFGQPWLESAVRNTLPDNFDQTIDKPKDRKAHNRAILPRALSAVGLKSSFVIRDLRDVDPAVFPAIVFRKDGTPLLLTSLSDHGRLATFIDLAEGDFTQELPVRKLRRQLDREMLLVTTQATLESSRLDPQTRFSTPQKGHWLWRPVRQNWSSAFQILVATLGINLFALALPIFVMNVYDRVIPNLSYVTLWTLAGGVAIALLLDLILKLIRTNVLETTSRRVDLKIASTLFRQAMNMKLMNRPGGAAGIANQIRDFETVRDFFTSSSFVAMIDVMFIGIFVAVLWMIVGPIAVVPLLAVPVVVILALIAQIPIGSSVAKAQQLATKRHSVLVESLMGIETVKSLNAEPVMQREWENAIAASSRITSKTRFWSNFAINGTMLVQQSVSVIIIVWGVYLVAQGQITVGGLIASNILAGRILAPLGNISQTLIRAQHAFKSLGAISELMKQPIESSGEVRSTLRIGAGAMEFRDVSLTYPGAPVPALQEFSATITPGETVALLGRVGSGKSTLGRLFSGLIDADAGLILIDGKELAQYEKTELRSKIGYLPQDPELFTGTIRENLLLGNTAASDNDLNRALHLSGMDYFIAENPEGLDQFIGEKGSRLSGGQRQAIGLARLLLRKPKVLFLDEPTNAMDNGTERTVIERLRSLRDEGITLVLSTHRHSLAAIAERIIVIDRGKKLMDGPHAEVMTALSGNSVKNNAMQTPRRKPRKAPAPKKGGT